MPEHPSSGAGTSVWVVLIGWCIAQAAMNGVLAAANATLADQVPVSRRGRVSGVVGIMLPVGILVGALVALTGCVLVYRIKSVK